MSVDLEKIKNAKGSTYIISDNCPIPICVEDYLECKNIEKELGIDPITFLKVVVYGCYVKDKWCGEKNKISYFYFSSYCEDYFLLKYGKNYEEHPFYFKDYGKTWSLTREELL